MLGRLLGLLVREVHAEQRHRKKAESGDAAPRASRSTLLCFEARCCVKMGGGRPSFMSPTHSSVARSPRAAYPSHAVTNGSSLVQHDRWPAAAAATEPSTKISQK